MQANSQTENQTNTTPGDDKPRPDVHKSKARQYRGKYPRRIASVGCAKLTGCHAWLNNGSTYKIEPITGAMPQPGDDFDALNGKTFKIAKGY